MLDHPLAYWQERGVNNRRLQFFAERWQELLEPATPLPYRVGTVGVRSLLREWIEVADALLAGSTYAWDQLLDLREEACGVGGAMPVRGMLKTDLIVASAFNTRASGLLSAAGSMAKQDHATIKALRAAAEDLLAALDATYRQQLISELGAGIFGGEPDDNIRYKECERISRLADALARDLLDEGISKTYLLGRRMYIRTPEEAGLSGQTEPELWDAFVASLVPTPTQHTVRFVVANVPSTLGETFRIGSVWFRPDAAPWDPESEVESDVLEAVKEDASARMAEVVLDASDPLTAVNEARDQLHAAVSYIRFGAKRDCCEIGPRAVVRAATGDPLNIKLAHERSLSQGQDASVPPFLASMNAVLSRADVTLATRRQLHAAFRYCGLGTGDDAREPSFLNMWIALEQLCRTGAGASTAQPALDNAPAVIGVAALWRRLHYLASALAAGGVVVSPPGHIAAAGTSVAVSVKGLCDVLADGTHTSALMDPCSDYALAYYHIDCASRVLRDGKSLRRCLREGYYAARWDLARAYRRRNGIVHAGEHSLNLKLLHENLNDHVDLVVRACVAALSSANGPADFTDLFARARDAFNVVGRPANALPGAGDLELLCRGYAV